MNENVEKRIIAFTSQSLRQYGMRAVRMDDIAKQMNVSKKTIYQLYNTKDKLINICVETYLNRVENIFRIIRHDSPDILVCLWEVSKAYIENLYRANPPFWNDVFRYSEYKYIFTEYNSTWSSELENIISICQKEKYIIPDLDISAFLESFTTLLYNARFVECLPMMLRNSACFMLRGIMTANGIERFERLRDVSCKKVN